MLSSRSLLRQRHSSSGHWPSGSAAWTLIIPQWSLVWRTMLRCWARGKEQIRQANESAEMHRGSLRQSTAQSQNEAEGASHRCIPRCASRSTVSRRMLKASLWQNGSRGEVHLSNSSMRQKLLPALPEQLLPHLRLELDLHCLKIFQPALGRDEGVVRAEEEAVLQAGRGLTQQRF